MENQGDRITGSYEVQHINEICKTKFLYFESTTNTLIYTVSQKKTSHFNF